MFGKKTAVAVIVSAMLVFCTARAAGASTILKKESRGSEVTALQKDLIKLGYLATEATGYFGDATEEAVKKLQKDYGYEADGIVGQVTFSLIDRLRGRSGTSGTKSTSATKASVTSITASLLKEGDENSSVKVLQSSLIKLGYLNTNATGYYGPATKSAVMKLQKEYGCEVDGIAGKATISIINRLMAGETVEKAAISQAKSQVEEKSTEAKSGESNTSYLRKWFGDVNKVFARGSKATVYDIKSGLSFNIMRTYGTNHADCETLTSQDTAIMKKIYGGSWSWERRPVIVIIGDIKIAGSMAGYPHAGSDKYAANKVISSRSGGYGKGTNFDAVKGNNMNGHFDIHFLGSKNHYNNKVDSKHQAVVKEAATWAEKNY